MDKKTKQKSDKMKMVMVDSIKDLKNAINNLPNDIEINFKVNDCSELSKPASMTLYIDGINSITFASFIEKEK